MRAARRRSPRVAPPTTLGDLLALVAGAGLVVSGDTGPLHLAAAVGTPIVGLYGPTDPARNGPWSPADVTVSRNDDVRVPPSASLYAPPLVPGSDLGVDEVVAAVERRLGAGPVHEEARG